MVEGEEEGAEGVGIEEGEEVVGVVFAVVVVVLEEEEVVVAWARAAAGKRDRERRTVRPKENGRASERARGRVTGRE
jgi:hypothetical protein